MRKILTALMFVLSATAFSQSVANIQVGVIREDSSYVGKDKAGKVCILELSKMSDTVTLNDCSFPIWKAELTDKGIIVEGGAGSEMCRVEIETDSTNKVIKATLSTKSVLKPIFTKTVVCNDLKQVQ